MKEYLAYFQKRPVQSQPTHRQYGLHGAKLYTDEQKKTAAQLSKGLTLA